MNLLSQPQLRARAVHSGRGIAKLMPGQVLEWQNGLCSVRPSEVGPSPEPPCSLDEACQESIGSWRSRLVSNSLQTCWWAFG